MKLPARPGPGEARKALVPIYACAAQLVALGLFHGQVLVVVTVILGLFGSGGVYQVRNADPPPAEYAPGHAADETPGPPTQPVPPPPVPAGP